MVATWHVLPAFHAAAKELRAASAADAVAGAECSARGSTSHGDAGAPTEGNAPSEPSGSEGESETESEDERSEEHLIPTVGSEATCNWQGRPPAELRRSARPEEPSLEVASPPPEA